jgi:hypothetical protein
LFCGRPYYFVLALLIGISGTYSSIFNAAPLLVVWHNRDDRKRVAAKSTRPTLGRPDRRDKAACSRSWHADGVTDPLAGVFGTVEPTPSPGAAARASPTGSRSYAAA